ncbi:hypothetical protein JNO48_07650 [Clostridiales bacterium]|jgi:uncharacterized ubiquitin-like protein YukD|nr:hypothetical protein JNO48_07650 [Clostridiales bacterium]
MNTSIVVLHLPDGSIRDVEIPMDISAEQLINALHQGLGLTGRKPAALRAENPIAYLSGNTKVADYGIHNGTALYY